MADRCREAAPLALFLAREKLPLLKSLGNDPAGLVFACGCQTGATQAGEDLKD